MLPLPLGVPRVRLARSTRALIGVALIVSLVSLVPNTASAQHRAPAPFIDSGTMNVVTDNAAADLDPASDEFYGSDTHRAQHRRRADRRSTTPACTRFIPKLAISWTANAE